VSESDRERKIPGKESLRAPLPKRFYQSVTVVPPDGSMSGYRIALDGRTIRTPRKFALELPTRALAEAVAAEWAAQGSHIDPAGMSLTRFSNSIIDGVIGREAEVRADVLAYASSDLLCYRAEGPGGLVQRQQKAWDRVLAWARASFGARLVLTEGVMPVPQPPYALEGIAAALETLDPWRLASIHVMTTLTGSALLALAHASGELSAAESWAAAHVDEDWQIEQWGEDAEARERREHRWREMQAASRLLALVDNL
jgi:chaperone required for assembly of F1-ATPase